MISLIVCSRRSAEDTLHRRNAAKTAGAQIEYLRIDNNDNRFGLCSAYNHGVSQAKGEILVFMHEDAFFMEPGWDAVLEKKFADPTVGLVGVAGTQHLFADHPGWVAPGRPFIKGKVVHETNGGNRFNLTVFSWDEHDSEVVAVDGVFFAIRKSLFDTIRFDEETFDGFHFYDLDICMQVRKAGSRLVVTPELLIKHCSGGSFDQVWLTYASRFREKHRDALPASCTDEVPDLSNRVNFENFDLKGKVRQVTIG